MIIRKKMWHPVGKRQSMMWNPEVIRWGMIGNLVIRSHIQYIWKSILSVQYIYRIECIVDPSAGGWTHYKMWYDECCPQPLKYSKTFCKNRQHKEDNRQSYCLWTTVLFITLAKWSRHSYAIHFVFKNSQQTWPLIVISNHCAHDLWINESTMYEHSWVRIQVKSRLRIFSFICGQLSINNGKSRKKQHFCLTIIHIRVYIYTDPADFLKH